MSLTEQIKIVCVKAGISVAQLGRMNGQSAQAFHQKLKRETFTVDEMKKLAQIVGARYETTFIMPNGDQVEY